MRLLVLFILFGLTVCVGLAQATPSGGDGPQLLASWNFLNFTFRYTSEYESYMKGDYKNCVLAGVKISTTGDLFISIPRSKSGVPATLNRVVMRGELALLEPFPSWEMNQVGNSEALQSVLGFEIDSKNRLWALDQGKVNGAAAIPGAIKLIVFDLNAGGKEIARHVFSGSVASKHNSYLNDIVVDTERDVAYIADSGLRVDGMLPLKGGLIVYDLPTDSARRILSTHWSVQPNETARIFINGERVLRNSPMMTGADGIALSADFGLLYWTPLTSHFVVSLETEHLRNFSMSEADLAQKVRFAARDKRTASDGIACSNEATRGILYATSLDDSSVYRYTLGPNGEIATTTLLARDPTQMVWPDTLGFDHRGSLIFTTNSLHRFLQDDLDFSEVNFRIWSVDIGAGSYNDPR